VATLFVLRQGLDKAGLRHRHETTGRKTRAIQHNTGLHTTNKQQATKRHHHAKRHHQASKETKRHHQEEKVGDQWATNAKIKMAFELFGTFIIFHSLSHFIFTCYEDIQYSI
jgi:hypothetical protein